MVSMSSVGMGAVKNCEFPAAGWCMELSSPRIPPSRAIGSIAEGVNLVNGGIDAGGSFPVGCMPVGLLVMFLLLKTSGSRDCWFGCVQVEVL